MPTEYIANRYMTKLGMPAQPVQLKEDPTQLDFDEVSKLFNLPVAEAAQILRVCPSVLKRICRENGLPRWPHRKVLCGRSIEEIKQEAARAKYYAQYSQATQLSQNSLPVHRPLSAPTNEGRTQVAGLRTKMPMASFLDDFRYGYPARELAVLSNQWWGTSEDGSCRKTSADEEDALKVASRFVRARQNKADCLRKTLHSPIIKGYSGSKLQGKEMAVLKFVFGDDLMPKQWSHAA